MPEEINRQDHFRIEDRFELRERDGYVLIDILSEKFDFYEVSRSAAVLEGFIQSHEYPPLIIDLQRINYIDSSAIGFLINLRHRLRQMGHRIVIICARADILHVMRLLNLPRLIPVVAGWEEALKVIREGT